MCLFLTLALQYKKSKQHPWEPVVTLRRLVETEQKNMVGTHPFAMSKLPPGGLASRSCVSRSKFLNNNDPSWFHLDLHLSYSFGSTGEMAHTPDSSLEREHGCEVRGFNTLGRTSVRHARDLDTSHGHDTRMPVGGAVIHTPYTGAEIPTNVLCDCFPSDNSSLVLTQNSEQRERATNTIDRPSTYRAYNSTIGPRGHDYSPFDHNTGSPRRTFTAAHVLFLGRRLGFCLRLLFPPCVSPFRTHT